MTMIINYL